MKLFLPLILSLFPAITQGQQPKLFGDRVVDCLVDMKVNADSPDFDSNISLCERRVNLEVRKEVWHRCIAKEASKLDDRISPASDIAQGVSSMCEAEFDAFLDGMTLSQPMKQSFRADRIQSTRDVALKIVLMLRAEAAKVPNQGVREDVPKQPKSRLPKGTQKQRGNVDT